MTSRREGTFLVKRALRMAIAHAAGRIASGAGDGGIVILDVGGRDRPYASLIAQAFERDGRAVRYLVVDPEHGARGADLGGVAEALPVASESVDLVVSTQVLEHVEDPARAVAEMARVLRPDGYCLLTTHGTWFYHPDPEDYWRWTPSGLSRLLGENGFTQVAVRPVGGTKLSLIVLLLTALERTAGPGLLGRVLRGVLLPPVNFAAERWLRGRIVERRSLPGELVLNYLVMARPVKA